MIEIKAKNTDNKVENLDWATRVYYCHNCGIWFNRDKKYCPECNSNDKVTT